MEAITNKTIEKLKYDLVRDNLISYEDFEKATDISVSQKLNIGQALINSGIITEDKLLKFLEAKLHIPYVELDDYTLDTKCLKYIHFSDAQKYKIIPLFKIEDELTIAMADPLDLLAIDKVVEDTGCSIAPVLSSEKSIIKKINEFYTDETNSEVISITDNNEKINWQEILTQENPSEEHIQKIIKAILKQAISEEIHELYFENTNVGLNVNFKSHGNIINTGHIPKILINAFISKLKTLSNLDPTISELPQLGKLIFKVDDINIIASISAFPTIQGERISLKIYKPPKKLSDICQNPEDIQTILNTMNMPGIVLVCGGNLTGKTHIIYSILQEIAKNNKNIMTIESITKYSLENVSQCELNENIGFSFDKAIRFIEFQSPDIIYFEGINTTKGLDYFSSLILKNKTLITEFLCDNIADLRNKLNISEFAPMKKLITCIVFIHNEKSIEVFDSNLIEKYLL